MRQPQGSEEEEDRLKRTLEDAMMDEPVHPATSAEADDGVSMRIKEGRLINQADLVLHKT